MSSILDRSVAAWEKAIRGMRTSQPTYKVSLLLVLLELVEQVGARAVDGEDLGRPRARPVWPWPVALALLLELLLVARRGLLRLGVAFFGGHARMY